MKTIVIDAPSGLSDVHIGEKLENIGAYLPPGKIFIVSDKNVERLYGASFPEGPVFVIDSCESAKTLDTVSKIYKKFLDEKLDRSSFVLGVGGGIVCDICGFAASTFMRGLRFGFAATTLLAQADAAVGGKNGVNYSGCKNVIGIIRQPEFVVSDLAMLATLPREEISNGFAEIVKTALIGGPAPFSFLESNQRDLMALKPGPIGKVIYETVKIKAGIVQEDDSDKGLRRILNFGHTFAHALEAAHGVPHGRAVSIGMRLALRLSRNLGLIPQKLIDRVERLLIGFGLPISYPVDCDEISEALWKDKKKTGDKINFILLEDIGKPNSAEISIDDLKAACYDMS